MYIVIHPDGKRYGPADLVTLQRWLDEGRVTATTTIEDAYTRRRMPASQVPGLRTSQSALPGTPATYANDPVLGAAPGAWSSSPGHQTSGGPGPAPQGPYPYGLSTGPYPGLPPYGQPGGPYLGPSPHGPQLGPYGPQVPYGQPVSRDTSTEWLTAAWAMTALALGFAFCIPGVGAVMAILGIVFSGLAQSKGHTGAVVPLIVSILALLFACFSGFFWAAVTSAGADARPSALPSGAPRLP